MQLEVTEDKKNDISLNLLNGLSTQGVSSLTRRKFLIGSIIAVPLLVLGFTGEAEAQKAKTTYWLGTRDGDELRFETQIPADAAAVIMNSNQAPGKGDDTTPRYRTFTYKINGKAVRFHSNEIGWETPKLGEGNLTWVVEAGLGADWKECNTKDPLWNNFAEALKSLATNSEGWSSAKVVIAESTGTNPPSARLNRDGSTGKPTADKEALWRLEDITPKSSLTPDELDEVRNYLLAIANGGRANPNYRREAGSKTALDLPTGLKPLTLSDILNKAAQNQAEYCARVKEATHDQDNPKYADLGARLKVFGFDRAGAEAAGAGPLQDYPTGWMKSETHYRPWWNLDGQVVTEVGFGVAKGNDGNWYLVAVLG